MSERFDFGKQDEYLFGNFTGQVSLTTGVPSFSLPFPIKRGADPFKVEPSQSQPSLEAYNRLVVIPTRGAGLVGELQMRINLSRDDGTSWTAVGPVFDTYRVSGNTGPFSPQLIGAAMPAGLFTDPAGATDIDDVLIARVELPDPELTSSITVGMQLFLLPSLSASQSDPMMGNVFSGNQY